MTASIDFKTRLALRLGESAICVHILLQTSSGSLFYTWRVYFTYVNPNLPNNASSASLCSHVHSLCLCRDRW